MNRPINNRHRTDKKPKELLKLQAENVALAAKLRAHLTAAGRLQKLKPGMRLKDVQ
jgi:hypothetical protein